MLRENKALITTDVGLMNQKATKTNPTLTNETEQHCITMAKI